MCTRVLVVDDDRNFRCIMRVILEDAGYQVVEASNGTSALAQLAQLKDDPHGMVVLLDLLMPGANGFDVLHALAQDEQLASRHAFIVVTAMDTRALPADLLQQLIQLDVPLLEKPFHIDELLEQIGAAAQRPHAVSPLHNSGRLAGTHNVSRADRRIAARRQPEQRCVRCGWLLAGRLA